MEGCSYEGHWEAQRKTEYYSAYLIVPIWERKIQAFQWLNTACYERDRLMLGLKADFPLDSLRSAPRFAELVRKVGLPQ